MSEDVDAVYFFDEFLALYARSRGLGYEWEREAWMMWGYEQCLQREEVCLWLQSNPEIQEEHQTLFLQRVCQLMNMEVLPSLSTEEERAFFLGMGFFSGLQWSQQISGLLYGTLQHRLMRWLEQESMIRNTLHTLLDHQIPHEHQFMLRQRAFLIQSLRKHAYPEWLEIREYLFSVDRMEELDDYKKSRWLQDIRDCLDESELETMLILGQGGMFSLS